MTKKIENRIILILFIILVLIGLNGCGKGIQNCKFNPGVTIESKTPVKNKDGQKSEDDVIMKELPVKVSPKGEVACNF